MLYNEAMKKKRYWLRGLLISIVGLVLIEALFVYIDNTYPCGGWNCSGLSGWAFLPVFPAFFLLPHDAGDAVSAVALIGCLLIYPLLGVLLGLAYGKIKKYLSDRYKIVPRK